MQLVAVDYQAENAQKEFVKSLRETGFGVLKNHPIQQSLVQGIYDNWQGFFDSEEKNDYLYNKGKQDGFFPQSVSEVAKGFTKKTLKSITTSIRGVSVQKRYIRRFPSTMGSKHTSERAIELDRKTFSFRGER